jgi:hypothetical protein
MPHIEVSTRINKDADVLWREVGSFQGVGSWHPELAKVEGDGEQPGAIRVAETSTGQRRVERLQSVDPRRHSYRYVMESSPMPVEDYVGEFQIRDEGDGSSTVIWSNDFQVTSGGVRPVARSIRDFLNAGIQNLKKKYA